MATFPLRNKALGVYRASQYWTRTSPGQFPDLKGGPAMMSNVSFGYRNADESWQDTGAYFSSGEQLYLASPLALNADDGECTFMAKFHLDPSAGSGEVYARTLVTIFSTGNTGVDDPGLMVSATHNGDTDDVTLHVSVKAYAGGWVTNDYVLGKGSAWDYIPIFVVGFSRYGNTSLGFYYPGYNRSSPPSINFPFEASLFDVACDRNMALVRPDITLPAGKSGDTLDCAVMMATVMRRVLTQAEVCELIQLDMKGYSIAEDGKVAPEDNAKAILASDLSQFTTTVSLDDASGLGAPGPNEEMVAVLVNPTDPLDFEQVRLVGVDVLANSAQIVRRLDGRPPRYWSAGTLLRGLLTKSFFQLAAPNVVPGAPDPSGPAPAEEITVLTNIDGVYPTMTRQYQAPPGKLFVPTAVGAIAYGAPISGVQVSFGYGAGAEDDLLASTALNIGSVFGVKWFLDFPDAKASGTISGTVVSIGTGAGIRFVFKGFLLDL